MQNQWNDLLAQAAQASTEPEVDLEAFMQGAWNAFVAARPGFKEFLEEQHIRTQLDELRKSGAMPLA